MLPAQLNRTWPEFLQLILATSRKEQVVREKADDPGYLQTAERCQMLFAKYGRLAKMPVVDRQFIGGTTKVGGSFGSIKGAGYFKERLNTVAASFDAALDHIPHAGAVSKRAFDDFEANDQWKRSGVGTASRLMAMKRPDLFLCVDAKNRTGIARAFGVSASSLQTFEGYWDVMQRIWRCPRNRTARPPGVAQNAERSARRMGRDHAADQLVTADDIPGDHQFSRLENVYRQRPCGHLPVFSAKKEPIASAGAQRMNALIETKSAELAAASGALTKKQDTCHRLLTELEADSAIVQRLMKELASFRAQLPAHSAGSQPNWYDTSAHAGDMGDRRITRTD